MLDCEFEANVYVLQGLGRRGGKAAVYGIPGRVLSGARWTRKEIERNSKTGASLVAGCLEHSRYILRHRPDGHNMLTSHATILIARKDTAFCSTQWIAGCVLETRRHISDGCELFSQDRSSGEV